MRRFLALAAASVLSLSAASAAPIEDFKLPGVVYDKDITTPDAFLGHGLGEKPIRHDQMVAYLQLLAEQSDRLSVETIGYTHERRPILFFKVTSPEHQGRIEEIREAHVASLGGAEIDADAPSIIWINYGVHGAESAGMDAAIPTLYHFAAAQGEDVKRQLEESVILIVAILNPDGHSRRVDHVETFSGAVPVTDPAHAVHNLWTAARTNHYWFDLNRQWLLLTQPESRAWVSTWQKWKPQVSGDFHEMGSQSTYYFHPGEPKRKNPLIPDEARDIAKGIAEVHREFLDSEGQLYFTEQGFDNFYIGKGSTYPQVNGGIGILFEVGAARGGAIESPSGERSYADNIRTHFRTTLTTINGTLAQKERIAEYQRAFFENASEAADDHPVKAYVVSAGQDRSRLERFLAFLDTHDIDVHQLAEDVTIGERTFSPSDSYVVPLNQDQHFMVRGAFDKVTEFEENIFYDVSGWTVPLAFDLDYAPLKLRIERGEDAGRFNANLVGDKVDDVTRRADGPVARSSYGYLMTWTDRLAGKALYRVLDAGLLARAASETFEVRTNAGLRNFDAGTVFIPLAGQKESPQAIHRLVQTLAREEGISVIPVASGAGDDATASLGGGSFTPIEKPSVLVVFDDGIARYDAGEVWHFLDQELRMPVTLRRKGELGGLDWSRYTHLIMPGGGRVSLPDSASERVKQWVREEGGTLIALRQSAHWVQDAMLSGKDAAEQKTDEPAEDAEKLRLDYAEMGVRDAEHLVRGAIFATDLDTSHPLGFGYADRMLPSLRNTSTTLDWPTNNPYAVVAAYPEEGSVLTGYVSAMREDEISGTPSVIAQPVGRGQVILMADNPVFRGFFLGTDRLLMNAVFFSDLIDSPSGTYEEE